MKVDAIPREAGYFDRYIAQVDDVPLAEALRIRREEIDNLDVSQLEALGDRVYAPGKWTVKTLIQHIIDAERILSYRALRFARNDKTLLPGFDEDLIADNSNAERRSIADLMAEWRAVCAATEMMFTSFDETALRRTGIMANTELPVLAVAFTILGHQRHHLRILEERYLPLLSNN